MKTETLPPRYAFMIDSATTTEAELMEVLLPLQTIVTPGQEVVLYDFEHRFFCEAQCVEHGSRRGPTRGIEYFARFQRVGPWYNLTEAGR